MLGEWFLGIWGRSIRFGSFASKIDISSRVEEVFFAFANKVSSGFKLFSLSLNSLESAK